MSTTPAASQNVVQPAGTQFSTNNLANTRYVTTSWNWVQTPSDNLGTAGNNTIHLSPCPLGLDTSNNVNAQYMVYIAGTGTAEAAPVTGGSCTPGSGAGTITVTTAYSHTPGYTVGSATSGIQEAINDSGTQRGTIYLLPASSSNPNYKVYATVFLNSKSAFLSGYGALVQCFTRTACIIDGNYVGSNGQFSGIEGLLDGRSGAEKKDAAMTFLESALATVDAVAARGIVNPEKFRWGISKIIDGTVDCLNSSTWAKGRTQAPTSGGASKLRSESHSPP